MAIHTRFPEIKKWAQSTGRRSIQLWMPKNTVRVLDRLCPERGMRRAELLDSLIREASGERDKGCEAGRPESAVVACCEPSSVDERLYNGFGSD